jgi:hypothetical protein
MQIGVVLAILWIPVIADKPYNFKKGKDTMSQSVIINGKKFANWQNTSFLPFSGTLKGDELWVSTSSDVNNADSPYHLCIADNNLITTYLQMLYVRNSKNGDRNWTDKFINLIDFTLSVEGIWVVGQGNKFYKHTIQNQKTEETHIALFTQFPKLLYLSQKDKDNFFYIYNKYPSSFDQPVLDDGFTITNFNVKERKVLYEYNEDNILITCFALSNDEKTCFLSTDNNFYSFPSSIENNKEIKKIKMPFILYFSVYNDDCIIAVQDTDPNKKQPEPKNRRIVSLSPDGKINWEVPINELSKSGQPPAFAPGGNIYYCAGSTLLCIKDSKIEWEYEVSGGNTEKYLTVLQDQSVLVAALNMLHHIDSNGTLIKSIVNPFVITCRPISDPDGKVYVAGKEGVRCLE